MPPGRSSDQIYCQQCSSSLCSLRKKFVAFRKLGMTQKLRSHYYELYFKTLVLSSVISALVFSKPFNMLLSVPSMAH